MGKTRHEILERVRAHYNYLVTLGYEVMFTALQGSQNYELDEYTDDYCSDVDTKSIVLPSLDDFIYNKQPVSTVKIMPDSEEHAEVKDIRIMFEMFKKENLSYIELLYSDYVIVNPKYAQIVDELIQRRDEIATADTAQFLKCIAGMAYEKDKALCHPYPGIIDKIEKYGYDGKQLSHCVRLADFITDFVNGKPLEDCYVSNRYSELMNYKKQLDKDGNPLSKEDAIKICDYYCEYVKRVKDENLDPDEKIDERGLRILQKVQYEILKQRLKEELENE